MKRKSKKIISVFLAILMAVTGVMPAVTAFAGDGVENFWDIQMFYKDTDTIVPEYVDETAAEKQEYVETMKEGQKLNLTYKLLNAEMPDNSYVKWYSDMPTLVDVDQNGVVKAFDSSKGAVIQSWIDNEVKPIPLVGKLMATVLEKALEKVHEEIDMVTTPAGDAVAMVHCNNCTSDLNAWVNIFKEFAEAFGMKVDMNDLFGTLYNKALEGDTDCGGLMSYNFFAGEPVVGLDEGRPLFVRMPDSKFNLANFMRANLYASLEVLKVGMDILLKEEKVAVDEILGHGGLFKTKGVGQSILAAALDTPVSVMETAGEGGAWGIALLASYMNNKAEDEALDDYLDAKVFAGQKGTKMDPDPKDVEGYNTFIERFKKTLPIMKAATETMK